MSEIPIQITRFNLIKTSTLTAPQRWFLQVINDYQGENPDCWPLQATLAEDCGYKNTRQVQRLVADLRELGVLQTVNRHNHSTRYAIVLEELRKQQRTPCDMEDGNSRPTSDTEDGNPPRHGRRVVTDTEDGYLRATRKSYRTPGPFQ